jgi:hypothetical protein
MPCHFAASIGQTVSETLLLLYISSSKFKSNLFLILIEKLFSAFKGYLDKAVTAVIKSLIELRKQCVPCTVHGTNGSSPQQYIRMAKDVDVRAFFKKTTLRVVSAIVLSKDIYDQDLSHSKWSKFCEILTSVTGNAIYRALKGM